ncbi:MAG: ABC transporter ATP-binding protein [Actinomycetota bacterium]|nr:ABC transporter ATP-binding protein [Actinomycetota bacterium]
MPEPALEARDVAVYFPVARSILGRFGGEPRVLKAVDGVSVSVAEGEALGLVGESGCGKSTLARSLVGLQDVTRGDIYFHGRRIDKRSQQMRRQIQMVFQDPYSSLNPRMTVGQVLAELLRVHDLVPRNSIDHRTRELLNLVRLPIQFLGAYPHQLSGGQRQRVSIARALALQPRVLIADEPVSALDVSIRASILNLLQDLRRDLGLTLILISHDLAIVRHMCDRTQVMYLGKIVETAATSTLFADPQHPYTQGLLAAIPRLKSVETDRPAAVPGDLPSPLRIPEGCRFHTRCPVAIAMCKQIEPELEQGAEANGHLAACHLAWGRRPDDPRSLITPVGDVNRPDGIPGG